MDLKPYSSARDEFEGEAMMFLDATENPFNGQLTRYPDPRQRSLKQLISRLFSVEPNQLFIGNGSDEAIDLLIRASCNPGRDRIISISPSYGMYQVCADIQDVKVDTVLLREDFSLDSQAILDRIGPDHKLIFLCSPNNPTGNVLNQSAIRSILDSFSGVVVVDEAYMDFADAESNIKLLAGYRNLVVLRTFSKAWGLAGARCGLAIGHPDLIGILSKIKYPYNMNQLTQQAVAEMLAQETVVQAKVETIRKQRQHLITKLHELPQVKKVYDSQANFVLIQVANAQLVYKSLLSKGIVIRDRSRQDLCGGCLRITVGTPEENAVLLKELQNIVE